MPGVYAKHTTTLEGMAACYIRKEKHLSHFLEELLSGFPDFFKFMEVLRDTQLFMCHARWMTSAWPAAAKHATGSP